MAEDDRPGRRKWQLGISTQFAPIGWPRAFLLLDPRLTQQHSAAFHAFQAELFPTRIRATGVGFTYSWSRLSAAFSSLLIGAVLLRGVPAVFALLAVAMTAVAVIVAVLGPRTNGVALEELSG